MKEIDFSLRSTAHELMDTEAVPFDEFRACLVDLATVNRLTLAYRPTIAFFERLIGKGWPMNRPLRVLDVGSGYGDMLRRVAAWGEAQGLALELTGVDMNPWSARAAREATPDSVAIEWVTADAFAYAPKREVDVIMSSLFTHHLGDAELVRFIAFMQAHAKVGWFVNDLHRHPLPYAFFKQWSKIARFHRFVQHDGPVSVTRAFSRADWRKFVRAADVDPDRVEIRWEVPFKLTVESFR